MKVVYMRLTLRNVVRVGKIKLIQFSGSQAFPCCGKLRVEKIYLFLEMFIFHFWINENGSFFLLKFL